MLIKAIDTVGRVNARIQVPGSKSITNRALVCAALAQGESSILHASDSDDSVLMSNALNQLGVLVRKNGSDLHVSGTGGRLFAPKFPIPVGNAGTTLRFLMSLVSLASGRTVLEGDMRMADRPNDDLLDALGRLGGEVQAFGTRYVVHGGGLRGGDTKLKADKSSQFLSSLLMVASYAEKDVRITVEGSLSSVPYVDITADVMEKFGVHVRCVQRKRYTVPSGQQYRPTEFEVEPDASGASYFFAAAAIAGGDVMVTGLTRDSLQGDMRFVDVLKQMGCSVRDEETGFRVHGPDRLSGIDIDMNTMPDVVPTLAVAALFAEGPTRIRRVDQLRYKESDRLAALAAELSKLGANIKQTDDGLVVNPAPLRGTQLDTHNDHRLAMSFALAGLKVPGTRVENPECVRKSFPGFWEQFEKLYGLRC